jgi:large conductance mechanosensitive channel
MQLPAVDHPPLLRGDLRDAKCRGSLPQGGNGTQRFLGHTSTLTVILSRNKTSTCIKSAQNHYQGVLVMKVLNDFKKFLFRGNVVDLAVAVVIGTAFTAVVKALVSDLLTPIIAMIFGSRNFGNLSFTINSSHFAYGDFLNNLFTFLTVAAAMFFFVVMPINWLMTRRAQEDPDTKQCPECDSAIPINARRCPLCTTRLTGGADTRARPGSAPAS